MKRIFRLLVMVTVLCFLPGCVSSRNYTQPDTVNYNYNNCTANNGCFWFAEDALCLAKGAPFLGKHIFQITKSKASHLATITSEFRSTFMVYEDNLYIIEHDHSTETNQSVFCVWEHNLNNNTSKKIGYFENLQDIFVFQNKLFYTQKCADELEHKESFHMYDLETEQTTCIHQNVLYAGVMNNQVVFVSREDSTYHIYSYGDAEMKEFESFEYEVDPEEYINCYSSTCNFTSSKIMFDVAEDLICYDVKTKQLQVFEFDDWIVSVIAYENHAFVHTALYGDMNQHTIYRIRLSDGFKEPIIQSNRHLYMYVDSDDYVYVQQEASDTIYRYTADGEKTLVYKNGIF